MNTKKKYLTTVLLIGIFNSLLLFYLKYAHNGIDIHEVTFEKTGNFINLIVLIIFSIGCMLLIFGNKDISAGNLNFLLFASFICIVPLLLLVVIKLLGIELVESYLFGYPIKKIIPVILLVINQIIFLYVLFLIWLTLLGFKLIAYIYSIVAIVLLIFVLLLASFISTYLIDEHQYLTNSERFEFGIVLGAAVWRNNQPSPIFRGRIEKGADLYINKVIDNIQLTGGNAPGELSEAKSAFNFLTSRYSIPEEKIVIEEFTSTTNEQIKYIKQNFYSGKNKGKFIFISDDFHLKRIEEMADFYDINSKVVSSEYKLNFEKSLYYRLRESIGLILFWFFAI